MSGAHLSNGWQNPLTKELPSQLSGAGTITAIVPHILSLRSALQATWNPALFGQREDQGREAERGDGEEGFSLDAVTEAVKSKKWWLQTEVVSQLNQFADEFSS